MQAIGLIETRGLIAAIESADVMLKSASVSLVEKSYTGGGLVTILVEGDVGAVKSAVDAAAAAVQTLNETALISRHVIARPHDEVQVILNRAAKAVVQRPAEQPASPEVSQPQNDQGNLKKKHKHGTDKE